VLYWARGASTTSRRATASKLTASRVGDYSIAFGLRNAAPEQNYSDSKKRYFVRAREVRKPSKPEKALAVAFEYRCLTEARGKEHGTGGSRSYGRAWTRTLSRGSLIWSRKLAW
jgi:hypothetical protein